ncbi:MAG: alpha/beta hydrolase [Pseudomonadota bacterium]
MFRLALLTLLAFTPTMTSATEQKLLTWPDLTSRTQPKPDATIDYGPDHLQKVDVWLPAGKGNHPTVLMVHGGCWTTSIADRSLMNWIADDLRRDGIAVWNIDYRGVDRTGGGYPGTFLDAAAAADALRDNAARFHLDTRRIVAVGHSAGGHLALWLAARANLPRQSPLRHGTPIRIAHVISLGGLPDLEATAASPDNGCGTEVVAQLVGTPSPARPDVYADTSVPRLLPLRVTQDLVNGLEDRIIPIRLGTGYEAQAKKAGDTVVLHIVPDTGHVELVAPESAAWTETKRLIRAALKE